METKNLTPIHVEHVYGVGTSNPPIEGLMHGAVIMEISNGNPNGDPDNSGMPRYNEETGHAYMTNGCIKAKIRNYWNMIDNSECLIAPGQRDTIQAQLTKVDGDTMAAVNEKRAKKDAKKAAPKDADQDSKPSDDEGNVVLDEAKKQEFSGLVTDYYIDARAFGAVLATANIGIKGPVQIEDCMSANVTEMYRNTIDRNCVNREADKKNKVTELGGKGGITYGLFCVRFTVCPAYAEKVHFGKADYEQFENAFRHCLIIDEASNRKLIFRKLIRFEHEHKLGNTSILNTTHGIKIVPKVENPSCFEDFDIQLPAPRKGVKVTLLNEYDEE